MDTPETSAVSPLRVLVATTQTQGQRSNDFCFVPEGELVLLAEPCSRDKNDPDGLCGCARSLSGVTSQTATTTVRVEELPLTVEQYVCALLGAEVEAQEGDVTPEQALPAAKELAARMLKIAGQHPVGTVLEYRGVSCGFQRRACTDPASTRGSLSENPVSQAILPVFRH